MALSDDEFELLLRLLKSSSDTEIKQHQSAWIQLMHQGMGKGTETGATRRSSREWFNSLTAMVPYMEPLFFELRASLMTFRIFVR